MIVAIWLMNVLSTVGVGGGALMYILDRKYGLRAMCEGWEGSTNTVFFSGLGLLIIRLVVWWLMSRHGPG